MTISSSYFYSSILGKTYEYYLLKSSDSIDDAFVLYVQDGNDYLELGGLEKTMQQLMHSNPYLAKRMIIVLIHPGDSLERWNSYHRHGESFDRYIQFMTEEFIPEIEKELSSLNINIVKRGLLGDSLGGNISLNIALKEPNMWTHLCLQSAAISKEDIEELDKVEKLNWNVYQTVGLYEDEFISPITNTKLYILSRNQELHQVFLHKQATIRYSEQVEEHLWSFWEKDLPHALEFFMNVS